MAKQLTKEKNGSLKTMPTPSKPVRKMVKKASLSKLPIAELKKVIRKRNDSLQDVFLNDEDAWETLKTRKSLYQLWKDAAWSFYGFSRNLETGKVEISHRASIMGIPIIAYFMLEEADLKRDGARWEIINPDWEKFIFKIEIDQDRITIIKDILSKLNSKPAKNGVKKISN